MVRGRRGEGAQDRALASHVLSVHKHGRAPRADGLAGTLPADQLRAYIAHAKQRSPFVPDSLTGTCPCSAGGPHLFYRVSSRSGREPCTTLICENVHACSVNSSDPDTCF